MKHPTKDPTQAEQERFFLETWERENAGLNGRHTEKVPGGRCKYATGSADPVPYPCGVEDCDHCRHKEKAARTHQDRSGGRSRPLKATSIASRLLEAAAGLRGAFYEWELMREAWLRWPVTFGIAGVENDFPSDKKVSSALSGKRGLVARGLFQRLPDGRLRVAGVKE